MNVATYASWASLIQHFIFKCAGYDLSSKNILQLVHADKGLKKETRHTFLSCYVADIDLLYSEIHVCTSCAKKRGGRLAVISLSKKQTCFWHVHINM